MRVGRVADLSCVVCPLCGWYIHPTGHGQQEPAQDVECRRFVATSRANDKAPIAWLAFDSRRSSMRRA
jgi:hypothetical protein